MKNVFFLLLILQYSVCVYAQSVCAPKIELRVHLKSLLEKDTLAYTRVRDKKRLEKVGNLVKNSYLYR